MKTKNNIFFSVLAIIAFLIMQMPTHVNAQSCSGNCGGSAGSCYCDDACWGYGDCCPDVCTYCGTFSSTMIANCGGPVNCLTCPSFDFTITATSTFQTHSSSIVTGGCKQYQVNLTAGNIATFTFCSNGGTANYDTYLTLRDASCTTVASNDDVCGLLSEIVYTVATTGVYYLEVNSCCTGSSAGNYTLAYRQFTPGPCDIITPILGCGISQMQTATSNGTGLWSTVSACGGYVPPGQEFIYEFVAPVDGIYSLEVVSATPGGYYFDYQWKTGSCSETGWNCISSVYQPGNYGSLNWIAGTTYYILLDAQGTTPRTQEFYIQLPASSNPCNSITTISGCGSSNVQSYMSTGTGVWDVSECGYNTPGQEKIYEFTPTVSGDYSLKVTSTNGYYADYFWKTSLCNDTGWICIDDLSGPVALGTLPLTAGITYYLLIDAESTDTVIHEFYIGSPPEPIVCPPGAILEGEPECYSGYVDSYNGGCNSTPNVFQTLTQCCGIICGKTGVFDSSRDTDWYELTTTTSTQIDISLTSESYIILYLIDGNVDCTQPDIIADDIAYTGDTARISSTVGAGTWWIWVGTDLDNWPCSTQYILTYNACAAETPGAITGPDFTCQGYTNVAYSIAPVANADSYLWSYSGTGAIINGNTENITIDFDAGATSGVLSVSASNPCGELSAPSPGLTITVDPCAGIHEVEKGLLVELIPNPSEGIFSCVMTTDIQDVFKIQITDVNGKIIWTEQINLVPGKNSMEMNMRHLANGTYFLIGNGNNTQFRKVFMINR